MKKTNYKALLLDVDGTIVKPGQKNELPPFICELPPFI